MAHPPSSSSAEVITHPLVDYCLRRLQPGTPSGEPYQLAPASLSWVSDTLKVIAGRDLGIAARELLVLAYQLDTHFKCPTAADVVLGLLVEQKPRLAALTEGGGDLVSALESKSRRAQLASVVGSTVSSLPVASGPAPQGSVKGGPFARFSAGSTLEKPKK
ncbi:MAG: hypothetical protein HY904_15335 [Deltaproteobacteria bacterium]|nr:hypothetical protein [Deltaproteobacteria bacterium]